MYRATPRAVDVVATLDVKQFPDVAKYVRQKEFVSPEINWDQVHSYKFVRASEYSPRMQPNIPGANFDPDSWKFDKAGTQYDAAKYQGLRASGARPELARPPTNGKDTAEGLFERFKEQTRCVRKPGGRGRMKRGLLWDCRPDAPRRATAGDRSLMSRLRRDKALESRVVRTPKRAQLNKIRDAVRALKPAASQASQNLADGPLVKRIVGNRAMETKARAAIVRRIGRKELSVAQYAMARKMKLFSMEKFGWALEILGEAMMVGSFGPGGETPLPPVVPFEDFSV
ncbi:hypothetical protein HIM_07299 [Hirsutella minnesotensis 3608]|uniref:Uncharacterized protein n=1 Tax=Hirsutella minnesotensis 3608 TaxID=1043627 RepID=A0A0F7ZN82_9HYPO|nr:hypothetical protein HIM_07299 [Hirsutella minnesotensis 3608]